MASALEPAALDQLFRTARTFNEWSETPVDEPLVRKLYDLLKWGPTSANSCPARFIWVRSAGGKAQLSALAMDKNRPRRLPDYGGAWPGLGLWPHVRLRQCSCR